MTMNWRRVTSENELKRLGTYEMVKEEVNYDISAPLKIKSRSWKELYDYINALQNVSYYILSEELEELEELRAKLCDSKTPLYFKRYCDEYIFYLLELSGSTRLKKLGVTKGLYHDLNRARKWYLTVVQVIHPEVSMHAKADEAMKVLNELYEEMIQKCLKDTHV